MAVIVFTCDTCKRTLELTENKTGFEVFTHCIITQSCKGTLIKTGRKLGYQTGKPTPLAVGLQDWSPRKLLFTHEQGRPATTWSIRHNLGVNPAVYAYKFVGDDLIEIEPLSIVYIDPNSVELTFNDSEEGLAQCVARSTAPPRSAIVPVASPVVAQQISTTGQLTIATRELLANVTITMQFLSPIDASPLVSTNVPFSTLSSLASPWGDTEIVLINGRSYRVRTANIESIINSLSIAQYAPFYFTGAFLPGPIPYPLEQVNILLGKFPYATIDKDFIHIVPMSTITTAQTAILTYQEDAELFVQPELIKQIYPPIRFGTL